MKIIDFSLEIAITTHDFPTPNLLCSCWCYWIPKPINKLINAHYVSVTAFAIPLMHKARKSNQVEIEDTMKQVITLFRTNGRTSLPFLCSLLRHPFSHFAFSSIFYPQPPPETIPIKIIIREPAPDPKHYHYRCKAKRSSSGVTLLDTSAFLYVVAYCSFQNFPFLFFSFWGCSLWFF